MLLLKTYKIALIENFIYYFDCFGNMPRRESCGQNAKQALLRGSDMEEKMGEEWIGRKESHIRELANRSAKETDLSFPTYKGKHVDAWGSEREQSKENGYRKWNKKYR